MRILSIFFGTIILMAACSNENISLHPDSFTKWYYEEESISFHIHLINKESSRTEPFNLSIVIKDEKVAEGLGYSSKRINTEQPIVLDGNKEEIFESNIFSFNQKGINEQKLTNAIKVKISYLDSNKEIDLDLSNVSVINN